MKLVSLLFVITLGGVASADDRQPVDPYAPPRAQQGQRGELRERLVQRFDRNGDHRLGPRERRHALRALRRLEHRRMGGDGHQMRRARFFARFDLNRDGQIGPGELPPALADELRPLDRDGDGWLRGDELP